MSTGARTRRRYTRKVAAWEDLDFIETVIWGMSRDGFVVPSLIRRVHRIANGSHSPADLATLEIDFNEAKLWVTRLSGKEDTKEETDLVVIAAKILATFNEEKLKRAKECVKSFERLLTPKAKKLLAQKLKDPELLAEYWELVPCRWARTEHAPKGKERQAKLLDLLIKLADEEEAAA